MIGCGIAFLRLRPLFFHGGQQAVQVVVHPDDLVKLKEVEELRRTIE
jgi:hypothetical protein